MPPRGSNVVVFFDTTGVAAGDSTVAPGDKTVVPHVGDAGLGVEVIASITSSVGRLAKQGAKEGEMEVIEEKMKRR